MFDDRSGKVEMSFSDEEAALLRRVIGEYMEVLEGAGEEPIRARLFPSASFEDPEVEDDYRQLTRESLEDLKRKAARGALSDLGGHGSVTRILDPESQHRWLTLLTDLRLAIGVKMQVTEESMEQLPDPEDAEQWPLVVLHYLGVLQDRLVDIVATNDPDLRGLDGS